MPVRIYDICKKLGLEHKEVLAKAKQIGIAAAKVPSSSLDKITAEWLEEELIKTHPEVAARLAPKPPPIPPGPKIGDKVGFIQLPSRPASPRPPTPVEEKIVVIAPAPPPQVRISEVARKVGLPIDQVQAIVKEFSLPFGSAPDSLNEDTAQELMRLVQSGDVVEKRLHAPTMLIWFVRRIFIFFGCLGIVRAQEIEPLGRRVKRFVEKMWFCWHLTQSVTHPIRSLGHLEWRRGCLTNRRVHLSKWRGWLLKSRRHPANWRWHLWAVCMDLTPVGGHLSPVDAASTVVVTASSNADTPSSAVETARLNVEVSSPVADFASFAVGISPVRVAARPNTVNWFFRDNSLRPPSGVPVTAK
jgi:hypothetical protein